MKNDPDSTAFLKDLSFKMYKPLSITASSGSKVAA
jgi:hypothetical protein